MESEIMFLLYNYDHSFPTFRTRAKLAAVLLVNVHLVSVEV